MESNNCLVRMAVLRALACAAVLILATPGKASADPARFNIAAQPLPTALKSFAAQAKMQLLYRYDIVSHATAGPVTGQLERHAALDLLLRGTGLEAVYSNDNTATIRLISGEDKAASGAKAAPGDKIAPTTAPPTSSTAVDANSQFIRVAQATAIRKADQSATANNPPEPGAVQEIVVVGVKQALETSQQFKKMPTPSSIRFQRPTWARSPISPRPTRSSASRASPSTACSRTTIAPTRRASPRTFSFAA